MKFQLPCQKKVLSYNPEQYCNRLGNRCDTCDINLTHQKCISLCKCYLFCHQSCFIGQFEPLVQDQDVSVECCVCKEILHIRMETNYLYEPNKNAENVIKFSAALLFFVICIIAIVLTLNSSISANGLFVLLYIEGLALGVCFYILVITVRDLLYRKIVKINDITPTRLQIQTSAFKDLDIQTNDELTKDYLIFESKKEKC